MNREMRYNEAEMGIFKSVFSDNPDLLKAMRKHFLQLELNSVEKAFFDQLKKPEVYNLIKKSFTPEIDGDAPLHQVVDLWTIIDVKSKDIDTIEYDMKSQDIVQKYLDARVSELSDHPFNETKSFKELYYSEDKDREENYIDLYARNKILQLVEMQLQQFKVLAGTKNETVEETLKRLQENQTKNSAK